MRRVQEHGAGIGRKTNAALAKQEMTRGCRSTVYLGGRSPRSEPWGPLLCRVRCSMGKIVRLIRLIEGPDAQFAKNPERPWTQDL
jgi:hypothetical protein